MDPILFLADCYSIFEKKVSTFIGRKKYVLKCNIVLCCLYYKNTFDDTSKREYKYFSTANHNIYAKSNIYEIYENMADEILHKMSEFVEGSSGWSLEEIINLAVNVSKCMPLRGSSYIPLPSTLKHNKALFNIENNDRLCFVYCIMAALTNTYSTNPNSYQNYHNILNLKNIQFPLKLSDIPKFEKQNSTISINVFGLNKKHEIIPLYHTKNLKQNHINLLYLTKYRKAHFCLIRDLAKICSKQISKKKRKNVYL